MDDFETPQAAKEKKYEDGEAERNAKQTSPVSDDMTSDVKEYESCGSDTKSNGYNCNANSSQVEFMYSSEAGEEADSGDESDFESFRSETDSELRKFVNTLQGNFSQVKLFNNQKKVICHFLSEVLLNM